MEVNTIKKYMLYNPLTGIYFYTNDLNDVYAYVKKNPIPKGTCYRIYEEVQVIKEKRDNIPFECIKEINMFDNEYRAGIRKKKLQDLIAKFNIKNITVPSSNLQSVKKKKRDILASKLKHECFKRDNYKCRECGKTNIDTILHCDHIKPVSQGGTDELSNLQTLCQNCNISKSDKCWKGGEAKCEN